MAGLFSRLLSWGATQLPVSLASPSAPVAPLPTSRILVDLIHSKQQNPVNHRLTKTNYNYDEIHGFSRLFDHLAANTYPWSVVEEGELSMKLLAQFDVLFINLPNENASPFAPEEVAAIHQYMHEGGGVLLIADHTNCYRHAEKLNPICKPFGIEIQYTSALDIASECVDPHGWISISRFDETHPTNKGIRKLSFQLGGTLKTEFGTAFLSPEGFADYWNPENSPSFIGDKRLTLDEDKEPRGSLPLIAARSVGAGRLVVVADQNIYGDVWLHYYDNFAHALNVFEWLAQRENDIKTNGTIEEVEEGIQEEDDEEGGGDNESKLIVLSLRSRPVNTKKLVIDTTLCDNSPGKAGDENLYSFFVNLNRESAFTAHAASSLYVLDNPRLTDIVIMPPLVQAADAVHIQLLQDFLRVGRTIVLLCDTRHMNTETALLLHDLIPDLVVSAFRPDNMALKHSFSFDKPPSVSMVEGLRNIDRVSMNTRLQTRQWSDNGEESKMSVDAGLSLSAYSFACIKSSWGDSLLQTKGRMVWDIARVGNVLGGRVIVFLQTEFFHNKYIGNNEANAPIGRALDGVKIQYWLMDTVCQLSDIVDAQEEEAESFSQCADNALVEAFEKREVKQQGDS